jgi:predicted TIM-barrel fold metal-dependent hydrolase
VIIDIHTHLGFHAIYPPEFLAGLLGEGHEPGPLPSIVQRWLSDEHGSRLIAEMDRAGITTSALLMIDCGVRYGDGDAPIDRNYAVHRALLERWPERFVVFGGVDPRRGPDGLERFRRSVTEWGFGGMKLYPPMGFSPAQAALDPYLDICAEHGIPVMTHGGDSLASLDNAFARTADVISLARRRPDVNVIMAHGGYLLDDPEIRRAMEYGNVWVDLAGFQVRLRVGNDAMSALGWAFRTEFNERVLFGSDYPLFHFGRRIEDDLADLRRACEAAGSDQRAFENVMHGNAARLLQRRAAA